MKSSILVSLFLLVSSVSLSQTLENSIANVENGLTFPITTTVEKDIITSNIIQRLKQNKIYGASVAVVNNGKIEWSKAYGVREKGHSERVTTNTLFQCASIGKIITALAVLRLVEEGKIGLDENVNNKLQRWKIQENRNTKTQSVTLRHLLSHSAGLTDDYGFLGYDPKDEIPSLLQILNGHRTVNAKKSLEIKTIPGKKERYSGGGYLILQLLIEDLSGVSYSEYVQQHIFDPLFMTHSTYDHSPDKNLEFPIAAGHLSNGKSLKNKKYHIYPEKAAAGPWTTAEDLAKLIIGIQHALDGKPKAILDQKSAKDLISVQLNNKGLGVNIKGVEKPEAFWHAGQNLGYTALLYGLIEKRKGAVILLNSDGGEQLMQEFMTSVANEYDWPVMRSYRSLEVPKDLQSALIGTYVSSDKSKVLSVSSKRGTLILKSTGSRKTYALYRIGDLSFTFKNAQDYYRLVFNIENKQTSMTYTESIGKTVVLKKVE